MKAFAVLLMVLFPLMGWTHDHSSNSEIIKKSSVALASMTSLELFHQAGKGLLWAVSSQIIDDEIASQILYADANGATRTSGYDCHLHQHGSETEAHCHEAADNSSTLPAPVSLSFSVDDFIAALSSALDIMNRKVSPVENLTAVKAWQVADQMFFNLSYQSASVSGVSHYMCHIHHGSDIDCHRSLNPGPQEPTY